MAPGGFICGNKGGLRMEIFHSYYFSLCRVVVVGEKHTMTENESRVCAKKEEKLPKKKWGKVRKSLLILKLL